MSQKRRRRKQKRANGEGSVYQLADGRWKALVSVGMTAEGKRFRRSRIRKSQADAVQALRELFEESASGGSVDSRRQSLSGYLAWWLSRVVEPHLTQNTYVSYKNSCDKHILPYLGSVALNKLNAIQIENWVDAMGKAGVKPRALQYAFVVLNTALSAASKRRIIQYNPCDPLPRPKADGKEIDPFNQGETIRILDETEGHRLHGVIALAMLTGMRQGEIFGLQRQDVNLTGRTLSVVRQATEISGKLIIKEPKSKSSIRVIQLPKRAVAALRDRQKLAMKEGAAAEAWMFTAPEAGGPIRRGYFRKFVWKPLLEDTLDLKYRGFHHTRHTYATLALAAGVKIAVVSKTLGHSKISTTLDTYGHVLEDHRSEAAAIMQKLLG